MGFFRDCCFFIALEQLIFYNVFIIQTINYLILSQLYDRSLPHPWGLLAILILQIIVTGVLFMGLLEQKVEKFLPWLIVNAGFNFFAVVFFITGIFNSLFFSKTFGISNPFVSSALIVLVVLNWIFWILISYYYIHLSLSDWKHIQEKDVENSVLSDTNTENAIAATEKQQANAPLLHSGWEYDKQESHNLFPQQQNADIAPCIRLFPLLIK